MKHKGLKIILAFNVLLFIIDFVSTIRVGEAAKYLEANPLFKFGGFYSIALINILVFALYLYWYSHTKNYFTRFVVIFSLVALAVTRIIVIGQNAEIAEHPPTIEQAKAVTQEQKTATINRLVLLNFLPALNGVIAFLLFSLDHKIELKG